MEPFRKGRLPAFGPVQKSFTGFTTIAPGRLYLLNQTPHHGKDYPLTR